MPPQEQEGPVYDWRTGNPQVTYDWRARSLPPTLTMQDVLQALGLVVPPPAPLPGLPSVPRPVQFAFDPLGPEQGPETLGEYGGYLLGAAASIPAGSLKLLQAVPQARIHSGLLKRAAASLAAPDLKLGHRCKSRIFFQGGQRTSDLVVIQINRPNFENQEHKKSPEYSQQYTDRDKSQALLMFE